MRQILYVSAARADLDPEEVEKILATSRRNNEALGITGLLLEIENAFLQILEGDAAVLEPLMVRIQRDPRHTRVTRLIERDASARHFPHWTMGFMRPRWREVPDTAFQISRAALDDRLETIAGDDVATLIDSFCGINAPQLGRTG